MFFNFLWQILCLIWRAGIYFEDAVYTSCNLFAIFLGFENPPFDSLHLRETLRQQNKIPRFEIRISQFSNSKPPRPAHEILKNHKFTGGGRYDWCGLLLSGVGEHKEKHEKRKQSLGRKVLESNLTPESATGLRTDPSFGGTWNLFRPSTLDPRHSPLPTALKYNSGPIFTSVNVFQSFPEWMCAR